MKPENLEVINQSFSIQAESFESRKLQFSREDYLDHVLSVVKPEKCDKLLEVAAGTCVCGRAFAPLVSNVVCIDATTAMLEVGKKTAEEKKLENMLFVRGYAEELPFLNDSFDLVFSRLAFHHFLNPETVFSEMVRVLKPGGKLVMIDMEAAPEHLRAIEDQVETLRDVSHVKNLSRNEMLNLFIGHGIELINTETTEIEQKLQSWMDLTRTPEKVQAEILHRMQSELEGGPETGFSPYLSDGQICFKQRWVLITGRK